MAIAYSIIGTYYNYINAHIVYGKLQDENINCIIENEHSNALYPSIAVNGGIRILVAETQKERAKELLTQLGFI